MRYWWFWDEKTRKLKTLRAIICANTRGYPPLPHAIYEVNNGNSDIYDFPRPMMEGECSL